MSASGADDTPAPDADFEQGKAALRGGAPDEAIAHFKALIARHPRHVEALGLLGDAYVAGRHWPEAIASYRAALALDPAQNGYRYNLATILANLGHHEEAVAEFRLALERAPDHAETHNNLGVSLQALGRYPAAIMHYQKAIALKPGLSDALANLGTVFLETGRLDEARVAFTAALVFAPDRCLNYFNLAYVHRFRPGDPYLQAMERLAADPASRDSREQVALHFALAQAYDQLGRHEESFRQLQAGNALKRREIVYDEAAVLGEMQRIARVFDAGLVRKPESSGGPVANIVPIFIVGMPRSGTTLVEQILASHPAIQGGGERYDLDAIAASLGNNGDRFPECVAALAPSDLQALGRRYLDGLEVEKPGATAATDKMTWNFRFLGLIGLILPHARVIHVTRNPVDTCLSCFGQLFTHDQEFSYDLDELGRYYRAYRTLMNHWRRVLPPGMMLELSYEALVADFPEQTRRMVAFCGLPWNEACLQFHRTSRPVRTASAAQVRQPLYPDAAARWRRYRPMATQLIAALQIEE